jgi:hypothetical protein
MDTELWHLLYAFAPPPHWGGLDLKISKSSRACSVECGSVLIPDRRPHNRGRPRKDELARVKYISGTALPNLQLGKLPGAEDPLSVPSCRAAHD